MDELTRATASAGSMGLCELLAGGVGGMCALSVGFPFDTLKVTMQRQGATSRILPSLGLIYRTQGVRGFFTGMTMPLLGVFPVYAVCFATYGYLKRLTRYDENPHLSKIFFAGVVSAAPALVIITPGERIKCILQVDQVTKPNSDLGPLSCIVRILRQEGLKGFYRGAGATASRELPANAIWFTTYEYLKRLMNESSCAGDISKTLVAGGFAGVATWTFAMPIDFVKTRVQTDASLSYMDVIRSRRGNLRSMYRGLLPVLVRAFPASAACFAGYETTMHMLKKCFL